MMNVTEKNPGEPDEDWWIHMQNDSNKKTRKMFEKCDEEDAIIIDENLYTLLYSFTTDNAKTTMKQVQEEETGRGAKAWKILVKEFSTKSLGAKLNLRREIANAPKIKSIGDIHDKVSEWEEKVRNYKTVTGRKIDE